MSEAPADGAEIDRAGPRRLRPKHVGQGAVSKDDLEVGIRAALKDAA